MRRQVPINGEFPYHVSGRTPNAEFFKAPLEETWQILSEYLFLTKKMYDLRIHAFVMMSNHYHLLATAPHLNISEAIGFYKGETSRSMNRFTGRTNQNWGRRHHKTLVSSYHYFMNAYKYIYRNPVRAGLCKRVEDYPYSTLSGLCGNSQLLIPVEEDTILFDPTFNQKVMNWLNTPSCPKDEEQIRLALRRSEFELARDSKNGNQSHLEFKLI